MRGCCRWCPDGVSRATCLLRTPGPAGRPEIGWCPAPPTCFTQAAPFGHFSPLPDAPPFVVGKLQKTPLLPVTVQPLASATFQDSPNQGTFSPSHHSPPCPRKAHVPEPDPHPGKSLDARAGLPALGPGCPPFLGPSLHGHCCPGRPCPISTKGFLGHFGLVSLLRHQHK